MRKSLQNIVWGQLFLLMGMFLLMACSINGSGEYVYIDPGNTGSSIRDGSKENPYLNWSEVTIASHTTYLVKRSSVIKLHRPLNINGKVNVNIRPYGNGSMPLILTQYVSKPVNIYNSTRVRLSDIAIQGDQATIYCIRVLGDSEEVTIEDCKFSDAIWGIRLIGFKKNNQPNRITIRKTEIHDTGDDGIFAQHVNNLVVDSCHIYKVNQKWFTHGVTESQAPGDGIQIDQCRNFTVTNSRIDRSDTGNKFCIIANKSIHGLVENNVLTGPSKDGMGGACIYFGYGTDSVKVNWNTLSGSPCGIYSHAKNSLVFRNIFKYNDLGVRFIDVQEAAVINNTFWNNQISIKGSRISVYNNIIYGDSNEKLVYYYAPYKADYNCYFHPGIHLSKRFSAKNLIFSNEDHQAHDHHSIFSDPLFEDNPSSLELSERSPCIDKGTMEYQSWGVVYTHTGEKPDMGAKEWVRNKE